MAHQPPWALELYHSRRFCPSEDRSRYMMVTREDPELGPSKATDTIWRCAVGLGGEELGQSGALELHTGEAVGDAGGPCGCVSHPLG